MRRDGHEGTIARTLTDRSPGWAAAEPLGRGERFVP
jgi:hypothetical protein